jgi:hypothetical protein
MPFTEPLSGGVNSSRSNKELSQRRVQFAFIDEQEQVRSEVRRFLSDKSLTTEVPDDVLKES